MGQAGASGEEARVHVVPEETPTGVSPYNEMVRLDADGHRVPPGMAGNVDAPLGGGMRPHESSPQEVPVGEGVYAVPSLEERRVRDRAVWHRALLISVGLHLLLFLLWPSSGDGPPESAFAAAGPRTADEMAADGMQAISMRSAPPRAIEPPPRPVLDAELPEEVVVEPETFDEFDLTVPDLPDPGSGATEGTDELDVGDAGIEGGAGEGDGGTAEEGLFRLVPPAPRGMIIPPTNSALRGQEIDVWVFVDEGGSVVADSTRLEPPTSDEGFNEQLIREAARWVFAPARRGGEPVAAWFPYTIGM